MPLYSPAYVGSPAMTMMSPLSPKTPIADGTLVLQLQQFFDDYTFRITHCSLGKQWSKKKALVVALELFRMNGVALTPEDIEFLSGNDEQMLPFLVRKMPFTLRENFERLSTQLNMLVHTAERMRTSLEAKDEGSFEAIMEEQDTASIKEQILKEAVIQASREVADLQKCQDTWVKNMEKRLDRLSRSAELAERAQQELLRVETNLDSFHETVAEKSKKALMGFAAHSTSNLLHSVFANWGGLTVKNKQERDFRRQFEADIVAKETSLIKMKERSMQAVKNALHRKSHDSDESMKYHIIQQWKEQVGSDQREAEEQKQLEELEKQFKSFSERQAINAKKVMARVGADNDEACACMAFAAWAKGIADLKEDRAIEEEAKKIEAQLQAFKDKSRDKTAQVMKKMGASTDTSLLINSVQGWAAWTKETIKSRDLENTLMGAEGKFKMLNSRQKGNAGKMQTRVNEQAKQVLLARTLGAWQLEAKLHHVEKYYNSKIEGKRKQLGSVQTLFKSFAKQLEEGLSTVDEDGEESSRTHHSRKKSGGDGGSRMSKGEGSVSLPNIHSRR